jgi:predicted RNase H-like HicB family nuclease
MGNAIRWAHCDLPVLLVRESHGWDAICLPLGVVTQGDSVAHAFEMLTEAVLMVIDDDLECGRDPLKTRKASPVELWQKWVQINATGEAVTPDELPEGEACEVTAMLSVQRAEHPAMKVLRSDAGTGELFSAHPVNIHQGAHACAAC